jgi:endonuclease/exonuclease/phosphatase family metal-dependent hydrolase
MRLISWNINARRDVEQQARALLSRNPDVVALQEATPRSIAAWTDGFDHIFASVPLNTIACEYLTAWREAGLSDHAAIEAVFEA